jgi:hypothetical protein
MTLFLPRFFFGFGWVARQQGPAKKVLCTTLSIALLNASLSPVYGMPRRHQANEAADVSTMRTDALKHTKKTSKKNHHKPSQEETQETLQETLSEAVQPRKSTQAKPEKASDYGISGYVSSFLKGVVNLVSRGISYILNHPGEALVMGLAAQVAATNAIRPITNGFIISQNTTGVWYPSVAALSNGNAFVVWRSDKTGTNDIYGRVAAPNGTALTNEFLINQITTGDQDYPSVVSLSNGNAFVVWWGDKTGTNDIYGRVLAPNGTALTNEFTINQNTAGTQEWASVATLSNGNVFVVWEGYQTGDYDIYGRMMAPNGTALSSEFRINQDRTEMQVYPRVAALSNDNAFVVWHGDQTGTNDIYGRVMAPNGTALTNEVVINQNTTWSQWYPSVTALNNGNAFVSWWGYQTGANNIYGRVMAPNGTALTDEFATQDAGSQNRPSVAALPNGNALVVWTNLAGVYHIYGGVVASNGTALSDRFTINQNTGGNQWHPSVAALGNGNAFVVWETNNAIYGRILDTSDPVATTGFQITEMPLNPGSYLFPILGVGAAAVGLSIGGSLITACALGGIYGITQYKKHQQQLKDVTNPSSHVEGKDSYGTPAELFPTKQSYGTPAELLPDQKAAN